METWLVFVSVLLIVCLFSASALVAFFAWNLSQSFRQINHSLERVADEASGFREAASELSERSEAAAKSQLQTLHQQAELFIRQMTESTERVCTSLKETLVPLQDIRGYDEGLVRGAALQVRAVENLRATIADFSDRLLSGGRTSRERESEHFQRPDMGREAMHETGGTDHMSPELREGVRMLEDLAKKTPELVRAGV